MRDVDLQRSEDGGSWWAGAERGAHGDCGRRGQHELGVGLGSVEAQTAEGPGGQHATQGSARRRAYGRGKGQREGMAKETNVGE